MAKVRGITLEIGGDTSKLIKAFEDLEKQSKHIQRQLNDVNKLLKFDPKNTELLAQKQKLLADKIKVASDSLEKLKQIQADMDAQGIDKASDQYLALKREIEDTEISLRNLKEESKTTNKALGGVEPGSNWDKIKSKIEGVQESLTKVGDKMKDVGRKMSTYVTVPIVGAIGGATKAAIDFESAFANVEKTVDGTDKQLSGIKQGIRDMSKEMAASSGEIANVAAAAGQLGIETDTILEFTEVMIKLGVAAEDMDAEQAAMTMAKFLNVTGGSAQDVSRLAASITELGNNTATTEGSILDMAMRLGSAGSQIGMSETDILALAASLSSVGLEAAGGGTAFSKLMINMQLAVETGTSGMEELSDRLELYGWNMTEATDAVNVGGKALKELSGSMGMTTKDFNKLWKETHDAKNSLDEFAIVAGMSADEFTTAFKDNATGALMSFIGGLSETGLQGQSAIKILDDMDIKEVRLRDSILRAATASDVFSEAIGMSNTAFDENIALNEEFSKKNETTESRLQILKNTLYDLGVEFGEKLLPIIEKAAEALGGFMDWVSALSPETKTLILIIGGLVAAIGPILGILGTLATLAGALNVAMLPMVGTVLAITAVIAGVIAIGVALWKNWDTIKLKAGELWSNINKKFTDIGNAIMTPITKAKDWVGDQIDKIKGFFNFKWSLPKLKMPKIAMEGKFSLLPPSVPKFSIKWMADGGIFNAPTLIPSLSGITGLGEYRTGGEVVTPLKKLKDMLAEVVQANKQSVIIHNHFEVDGKEVATVVTPAVDKNLGALADKRRRGIK